jgi:hypothetical protein
MLVGIKEAAKSNRVNFLQKGLPLPIREGTISVSLNFESHPSGSISIQGVSESEIDAYRAAYNSIGKSINLFSEFGKPIAFEISNYAETEDAIYLDQSNIIKSYDISINLRGKHERKVSKNKKIKTNRRNLTLNGLASSIGIPYSGYSYKIKIPTNASADFELNFNTVLQEKLRIKSQIVEYHDTFVRTKNYRSGNIINISTQDIIYSIDINKAGKSYYKDTELSLAQENASESDIENAVDGNTKETPKKLVLTEGDEEPSKPPLDVKDINSLDLCFDFSGPRKTKKVTTLLNGQPFEEEIWVYGFVYLGQQIRNPIADTDQATFNTKALLANDSTEPSVEDLWQVIEYQKTSYIYQDSQYNIKLVAKDSETEKTIPVKYQQGKTFDTRFLTGIITKGWKFNRFQQEQYDDSGSGNVDFDSRALTDQIAYLGGLSSPTDDEALELEYLEAQLDSITFKKLPFSSKTQYRIVPQKDYYEENDEAVPYETKLVDKAELGLSGSGKVVAAYPDPAYVLPMLVLEEKTLKQSFDQIDHPQNIIIRAERKDIQNDNSLTESEKDEALKETKLLPWLTTGEDTYNSTVRKIVPSKNTGGLIGKNPSASNDVYVEYQTNASSQDIKFQNSLQEIQYKTIEGRPPAPTVFSFEYKNKDAEEKEEDEPYNYVWELNSSNRNNIDASELIESVSYPTNEKSEALQAAKIDLELGNFLNTSETSLNLAWWYPQIRPGDYLNFIDDASKQNYRVKSVNLSLDLQGYVGGELLCTTKGTSVSCGQMESYTISSKKKKPEDSEGFTVSSSISGADYFNPNIYPEIRTRRNPNNEELDLDDPAPTPPL